MVFRHGAQFEPGRIRGRAGERWAVGATMPVLTPAVSRDSVVALTAFHRHVHQRRTMLANLPAAYLIVGYWIALALDVE